MISQLVYSSPQYDMIKNRFIVTGTCAESFSEEHEVGIKKFIDDPECRILVAYNDQYRGFKVEHSIPSFPVQQLSYFLKFASATILTNDNFLKEVQYGAVKGGHIESLLRVMMGIYAPIFFENRSWPDSIKNDFSAQLHRFLASLTDTRWKLEGKTVLYVPTEGLKYTEEEASKNKELVQRLESKLIIQSCFINLSIYVKFYIAPFPFKIDQLKAAFYLHCLTSSNTTHTII